MTKEKKAAKTEVRTLIPETVRKAGDKISGTIREYNQKYVVVTLEKGRKKANDYNEKYVVKTIENGKKKAKAYNEKYVSKPIEKGVAEGRKIINRIPMVATVEKKVTDGLQRVPAMFNMPSKGEIEKLNIALENLNSSIETLKKTQ
ncbi:MAG: hypothetical protein R6T92_05775 [Desulfosalsimonadaceae bacterium]